MRVSKTLPFLGLSLALLMVLAVIVPAAGYIEQQLTQTQLSGPNVVKCSRAATITAKVVATKSGRPIARQIVHWSIAQAQSPGDGLSAASTITNDKGKTSVTLTFGPAAGPRVVRASAGGSSPAITVRCSGGLPATAPEPPAEYVEQPPAMLLAPPPETLSTQPLPATALRVERLGIDLPLVEGDGYHVVEGAANHYAGTAWPGEGSNTYVYGHSREGQFLELWQTRQGDHIEVDMADGTVARYEVSAIEPLVAWDAFEYLQPTDEEILTLQTCLDYAETAPRFVVIAKRIGTS